MQRRPVNRRQVSRTASLPAPVGGWNAREPISNMPPTDAVQLDNFFPKATVIALRDGYTEHVTGITGTPETLVTYNSTTASEMFAATSSAIYDVTAAGAVGAAVVSGLTNGRWQSTNITTAGGDFMYMVNGADDALLYDGSTWTAVDGVSTPAITGVTTSNLIHVNLWKNRLFFVEKESLKVWYMPTASIGGAASAINFTSLFTEGGYLMAMGTWTIDAGYGMDDHAVFITSRGQVAVYRGTDPSSASTFALVGLYTIGSPVGRRCFANYGSDLIIICQDGLQPLSKALMSSRVNTATSLTDKIQQAMSESVTIGGSLFGWEVNIFPKNNMVILNVPYNTSTTYQYVMNTITGAWCRFIGWNATTWTLFGEDMYFAIAGTVCKAFSGTSDNGLSIAGDATQAFSYFGRNTSQKRFLLARPILYADSPSVGISLGVAVDFDLDAELNTPSFSSIGNVGIWDSSVWDGAVWGGDLALRKDWLNIQGVGYAAALRIRTSSLASQLQWASTDYVMEDGAII